MFYLEFAAPKKPEPTGGPAINIIKTELDTIYKLRLKLERLHDTETIIQAKYETLYFKYAGDTSCATTKRLLAMHRLLDSCGK